MEGKSKRRRRGEDVWKIGEYFPWMENDARRGEEGGEGSRLIEAILESTALQRFLWVKGLDFKEAAPIQRLLTVRENSGRRETGSGSREPPLAITIEKYFSR